MIAAEAADHAKAEKDAAGLRAELAAARQPAPSPRRSDGDDLNDPNFPANHPRITPGDVAYKIAARERARRANTDATHTQPQAADPNGRLPGDFDMSAFYDAAHGRIALR